MTDTGDRLYDLPGVRYAVDAVRVAAERVGGIGAFLHRFVDASLAAADRADAVRAAGHPVGPLHGIPLGITDILSTREAVTTAQSVVLDPGWSDGDLAPLTGDMTGLRIGVETCRRWWADYSPGTRTSVVAGALFSAADYVQVQRVRRAGRLHRHRAPGRDADRRGAVRRGHRAAGRRRPPAQDRLASAVPKVRGGP